MTDGNNEKLVYADQEQVKKEIDLPDPKNLPEDPKTDPELSQRADDLVARILNTDANDSETRQKILASTETMGLQLQKEAARRSVMLKQPLSKLMEDSQEGGNIAHSLVDLKLQVEELDPAQVDLDPGWFTRILGKIPGVGTGLKRYFSRFENASTSIDAIVNSLEEGREQLKRDNIILADDQVAMRELTIKLEKTIKLGQLIDSQLQAKLDTEIPQGEPKHKFISEEILFPLRQRIQDLQQQLLVNQQGFLTMEMIIRNNKELMRGVNRALTTTVSALQVGVTLALALANQKIVLEKVQAINTTTESLIAGTAERLKTQGAEIQKQASSTQINMDVLKQAFADVSTALEDIDSYRQQALPEMAKSILEMDQMSAKAESEIKKVEKAETVGGDFSLEITDD
jgi:uncharacterized protein YaaN involved in tellurite resistance